MAAENRQYADRLVVVQGVSEQMHAALGFAPGLVDELAAMPGVEAVGGYDWRPSLYDTEGQAFDNVRIEPRLVALLGGTPQLGRLLQQDEAADAVKSRPFACALLSLLSLPVTSRLLMTGFERHMSKARISARAFTCLRRSSNRFFSRAVSVIVLSSRADVS